MIKKIDKVVNSITGIVSIFAYVCLVGTMLLITVDVLMRKIFGITIVGSYEIVERMLLVLVFAAFAYCQTNKQHIHVTMFIAKFPKVIAMALFGIWNLLATAACVIMGYSMILQGAYAFEAGTWTPVLYIPLYPFYYIAAVGTFVFALVLLWDTAKSFIAVGNKPLAEEIESQWS